MAIDSRAVPRRRAHAMDNTSSSALSLHLFGGFRLLLDGEAVNGWRSERARALLAYLAVEHDTGSQPPRTGDPLLACVKPERRARQSAPDPGQPQAGPAAAGRICPAVRP